jgi:hypothetical protein
MRTDPTGNIEILDGSGILEQHLEILRLDHGRNVEAPRIIYEQRIAPAFHRTG